MPDLLTHVLVAYVLATLASFRYGELTPPFVTVAMMGAMIPDLAKIDVVAPSGQVAAALGLPFDWFALHTVGGAFVAALIGAVLAARPHRRRVFALLALGVASHLFLDALLLKPAGHGAAILWPLTERRPPSPGLYLSSDRWPSIVAGAAAAGVSLVRRRTPDPGW